MGESQGWESGDTDQLARPMTFPSPGMFQRNLSDFHAPLCLVTQVESLAWQVCPYSYSFCANMKSSETVCPLQTKGLAQESSGKFFTVSGWEFC